MADYKPPFEMTDTIANLTADIAELAGEISVYEGLTTNPTLRRENRIKTIHSSLAIEQNTLTIDQVTDVINGKRVLAPPADMIMPRFQSMLCSAFGAAEPPFSAG